MSQQGSENWVNDLMGRVGQTLRSLAETVVQETKELGRIGKLKLELLTLENERGRKLEELGRAAHSVHKSGGVLPADLLEILNAVDDVDKRIADKNTEVERLRAEERSKATESAPVEPPTTEPAQVVEQSAFFCVQCGALLEQGDVYCAKCGAKTSL